MLTSFTPGKGPHASGVYTFPREIGDINRQGQMDLTSLVKLENQDGQYDTSGLDRMYIDQAQVITTLDFNEYWLKNGAMGDYVTAASGNVFAARDAAMYELVKYTLMGGLGRLTETKVDGTVFWAMAKVSAWSFPYVAGAGTIRPQLTFTVLSGCWNGPGNLQVPIF